MRLEQRVVVVVGGSRGLGRAIALDAAREGARVVVGYRRREREASEVAAEAGNGAIALPVDVCDPRSVDEFFGCLLDACGRIDGLVTSAGIAADGWLATLPIDHIDDVVMTNLRGTMLAVRASLRPMMARKRGSIVTLGSVAGVRRNPGQSAYAASKGGIHAFVKTVAGEVGRYGIRVNALTPGLIDAGMVAATSRERIQPLLDAVPLGRLGEAREVARAATFLLSDDASFITGHILLVDGGLSA